MVHHCMVDGVGGVEVTTATMRTDPGPDPRLEQEAQPFRPRPVPSRSALVRAELGHRARGALGFARAAFRALTRPQEAAATVAGTVEGLIETFGTTFRPASPTPFNVEIGPHRRFDWTAMDLAAVKPKSRLGGTVNDVVLALVAGATSLPPPARGRRRSARVRAMVPVNLRAARRASATGWQRARACRSTARPVRRSSACAARWMPSHCTRSRRPARSRTSTGRSPRCSSRPPGGLSQPFNLVVTNVPGPQFPLYFLGSRLVECYPLVPIFHYEALGIALFSYDGRLFWGFNADWDVVPDLHDFVGAIDEQFRRLCAAAGLESAAAPWAEPVAAAPLALPR
jgi:WS/DGAT/MGAT family acyltransferase